MPTVPSISDAEWQVMDAIWSMTPPPVPAADVVSALCRRTKWSPRTVKTLLNRLKKKGALSVEADGRRYLYRPNLSRQQSIRAQSRSFLDRFFGGETGAMLAYFAADAKLSPKKIEELKAILDGKFPPK